jgi:hypothetical protein
VRRPVQADLLEWVPPAPVQRFEDVQVRAASIAGKLCRGISQALKDSGHARGVIAERMTAFLGEDVTANMLNAYASPAREDQVINVVRFVALIHATQDRRLLELLAETFGWIVIERRYLRLIELAALQEQQDELRRRTDAARRQAKSEGLL